MPTHLSAMQLYSTVGNGQEALHEEAFPLDLSRSLPKATTSQKWLVKWLKSNVLTLAAEELQTRWWSQAVK